MPPSGSALPPPAAAQAGTKREPFTTVSDLSDAVVAHVEHWGFGRVQLLTFAWCCMVWICSNSLVSTAIPIVAKGLVADLGLSTADMGLLQALVACGAVAGGFVCAELLEYFGRRGGIFIICAATPFILLALAATHGFWTAAVLQFLLGIVSCTETLAVKIMLSEVLPSQGKGFWINIIHVSYQGGAMVSVFMEHAATTTAHIAGSATDGGGVEEVFAWRQYTRLLAAVGVVVLALTPLVPESQAWAAKQPRQSFAVRSVLWQFRCMGEHAQAADFAAIVDAASGLQEQAAGADGSSTDGQAGDQTTPEAEAEAEADRRALKSQVDHESLLGPKFRTRMLLLGGLWAARCYLKYSNSSWLREYLERAGLGSLKKESTTVVAAAKTAALVCIPIMHSIGGVYGTVLFSLFGASTFSFALPLFAASASWTLAVLCLDYFCEETINSAGLSYVVEAFPPHVRSRASGIIVAVSRLGGVVGVLAGGALLDLDPGYPFFASGSVLFVTTALFAAAGARGKPGRAKTVKLKDQ